MTLAANALTDYVKVGTRLRLSGTTDQALLEDLIAEASAALDTFTVRTLIYQGLVSDQLVMRGDQRLLLGRNPIVGDPAFASIRGAILDRSEYSVDDAGAGILYRAFGWPWSAAVRRGANFNWDLQAGTERKEAAVSYSAGYITAPQAYSASAWPGATTTIQFGLLCKPGGKDQLWRASWTTNATNATTGSTEPTWATPAIGDTRTDGGVTWTFLGTAGSAGTLASPGARGTAASLPLDLERACVLTAIAAYRGDTRNPNVQSESVLGGSQSYFAPIAGLPQAAALLAAPFARGS